MHRFLFLSSCLTFLFFISAPTIHADTVVITGGTMRLTPSSVSMNFTSSNVVEIWERPTLLQMFLVRYAARVKHLASQVLVDRLVRLMRADRWL